ncbi:aldo/keto reductase [Mangrovicoccus algicola]|uniref:Aldo/keto reductase n=1 Tax=Mangrovicoccus algicola TaxID=2771008 RepID=A0A8J6YY83_9RHOB|nr:aldo/keto reductase [Mangrovicoccus algicola]MBE3639982.1 aldo/keto reductase [Mangrovicoccus algicola]
MTNLSEDTPINGIHRRDLLGSGIALSVGAAAALGATALPARAQGSETATGGNVSGTRRLGSLEVSPIGMGCMSMAPGFYNPAPEPQDMVRVLRNAHELGITFFDTAEVYGPFISERIAGEALEPIRDEVVIGTKFGFSFNENGGYAGRNSQPAHIKQAVEGMLERLRTDRIDLLYLHRMDPNTPIEDIAGAVGDLIREGKVLEFGVSEVSPEILRGAHALTPVAAVQSEYSVFERLPEVAMFENCEELGVSFVPWGPVMRGLTTDHLNEYSRFDGDRRATVPFFAPDALVTNMEVVRLLRRWADGKGVTQAQISLAWMLAQKPYIVPIPGTTKLHHARENFEARNVSFTSSELARFNEEFDALPIAGNRPESAAFESQ